jgi:hypothetical protein
MCHTFKDTSKSRYANNNTSMKGCCQKFWDAISSRNVSTAHTHSNSKEPAISETKAKAVALVATGKSETARTPTTVRDAKRTPAIAGITTARARKAATRMQESKDASTGEKTGLQSQNYVEVGHFNQKNSEKVSSAKILYL